jgi:hypothetical protein
MPNQGSPVITPSTVNQPLPVGYVAGGYVAGDPDLAAGNIRQGINIFGVVGNVIQASGNAGAAQVLTGYSASNASGGFAGSMPNHGTPTWTPGTGNQGLPAGYYGGGTVLGDPDLVASNIRAGVQIFNVLGSLIEGKPYAGGVGRTEAGSSLAPFTVSGLGFRPGMIYATQYFPPPNNHYYLIFYFVGAGNPTLNRLVIFYNASNNTSSIQVGTTAYDWIISSNGFAKNTSGFGSNNDFNWWAWGE